MYSSLYCCLGKELLLSAGESAGEHKERVRQLIRWLRPRGSAVRRLNIACRPISGQVDPVLFTRLVSLVTAACGRLKQLTVALDSSPGVDWADVQQVVVAALACPVERLDLSFKFRTDDLSAPLDLMSQTLKVLSLKFEDCSLDLRELACLTQLTELQLSLEGSLTQYTLPHAFSCMSLRSLTLRDIHEELAFEPGWGMSSLESLTFERCSSGYLVPGLDACTRLTALCSSEVWYTDTWDVPPNLAVLPRLRAYTFTVPEGTEQSLEEFDEPGHLRLLAMCTSSMQGLETLVLDDPAFESFPDCLSVLRGLQSLRLGVRKTAVVNLPAVVTNLSRLRSLSLGFSFFDEYRRGTFNVAALGSLSAFPCLKELCFSSCWVEFSDELASAEAHTALSHLKFVCAYPCMGQHMLAVLALHRHLRRQGRQGVSVDTGWRPTAGDLPIEEEVEEGHEEEVYAPDAFFL